MMKGEANISESAVANFVLKAYEIINGGQHNKVIGWMNNGKEFAIKDVEEFQEIILPKYFRHRNINSFIRQLNMYGFHKSRKEPTKNIFSHPFFHKDKPEQLNRVRRKIKNEDNENETPRKSDKILKEPSQGEQIFEKPTAQKEQPLDRNSLSLILKSGSELIEKQSQSPLKALIGKSFVMDINPSACLSHESIFHEINESVENEEDLVSLADEIKRERIRFNNRTSGISIVKSSNFLQDFEV